jgi:hypothetical protein
MGMTNDGTGNFYIGAGDLFSSGNRALTITSSRNVGIGTSSPAAWGGSYTALQLNNTGIVASNGTNGTVIGHNFYYDGTNDKYLTTGVASRIFQFQGNIRFELASSGSAGSNLSFSEAMRITSGGKLCVQSTTTIFTNSANRINGVVNSGGEAALEVSNSGTTDASPAISCYKANATTNSDARFIQFYASNGTTAMGGIVGNGTSNVQFASISDIREKENIVTITGSLSKILALNPVEFDWKKTKEHVNAGFVAQQVEEVFPEYVVENMSNDGEEERKGLTGGMSSGIIAHLVAAIQEQQKKIDAQDRIIEELKELIKNSVVSHKKTIF